MTYNPASQIATRSTSNDAYAYTAELDVDRNYTVNGLNQYSNVSTNTDGAFGYDLNGNLTFDGASTFAYDIENRLIQSSGPKSATLRYDPYFFVIAFFEPGSASPSLKSAPGRLVACNHPPDGHVNVVTLREIELEALTNIIKRWSCEYS